MFQDLDAASQIDITGQSVGVDVPCVGLGEIFAAVCGLHVGPVVVAATVGEAVVVLNSNVEVIGVCGGPAAAQPRLQEVPLLAEGLVFGIFLQVIAVWSDN